MPNYQHSVKGKIGISKVFYSLPDDSEIAFGMKKE